MADNNATGFSLYYPVYEMSAKNPLFGRYLQYAYKSSLHFLNENGWNPFTNDNPRILLCGVGSSTSAHEFAHFVATNTKRATLDILDMSNYPLKKSKAKLAKRANTFNNLTIDFIRANALKIPLADSSLDYIETDLFIRFFSPEQRELLVKEWVRVLKPGGTIMTREIVGSGNLTLKLLNGVKNKVIDLVFGTNIHPVDVSSLESMFKNDQLESRMDAAPIPFTHFQATRLPLRFITARKK